LSKPDWDKIRIEYEATGLSHRKLAEKYGVPYPTLRDRAKREQWTISAQTVRSKIVAKARENVATKRARSITKELDPALEATEIINQLILETLKDTVQFKRHLIQRKEKIFNTTGKTKDTPATTESSESWWVEEKQFEVVDTKRLMAAAQALKISKELQRLLNGILSEAESQKLQIEREKLDVEKQKVKGAEKDEVFKIIDPFEAGDNDDSRPE
jgi:hypothetical protein